MAKQRIIIIFDYDNDQDIKVMLAGQARLTDSPFDFIDASVKEHITGDWKEKVKRRINNCDQKIVLCGTSTNQPNGVAAELAIARELKIPYFLLEGRADKTCCKPITATISYTKYNWTWPNLKLLIGGSR